MASDIWHLLPGNVIGLPELANRLGRATGNPLAVIDGDGSLLAFAPAEGRRPLPAGGRA